VTTQLQIVVIVVVVVVVVVITKIGHNYYTGLSTYLSLRLLMSYIYMTLEA